MSFCNGNGECVLQCYCNCYNEETDEYDEICVCGHREHNSYCPSHCCVYIECRNYKYCNNKHPKWYLDCNNGMCVNCAVQMGDHLLTNTIEECCVCLENKQMIVLKCYHVVCNDCWFTITKECINSCNYNRYCPLCRNINECN